MTTHRQFIRKVRELLDHQNKLAREQSSIRRVALERECKNLERQARAMMPEVEALCDIDDQPKLF